MLNALEKHVSALKVHDDYGSHHTHACGGLQLKM